MPHDYRADNPSLDPLLSGNVDYLVRMIRMREIYAIELMLAPLGLTVSAWLPLAVLLSEDGMSQRDLGSRLNLKDAGIGKSIDSLERAGLVVRYRDLGDRRKVLVYLTDEGRTTAAAVSEKRVTFQSAAVDGFSEAERETFYELLTRTYDNIGALIRTLR